jgi:hypothetical protein
MTNNEQNQNDQSGSNHDSDNSGKQLGCLGKALMVPLTIVATVAGAILHSKSHRRDAHGSFREGDEKVQDPLKSND